MGKTAFVFPGQASQFVGMGLDFYNRSTIAIKFYDYAEGLFDFPLKECSFYGPLKNLTETKVTQPAIFVHSLIVFEELKAKGCIPDMVAGHSLGEYSALAAAETLSFEDGLEMVKIRSEQMQIASQNHDGTMAAIVGLSYEKVKEVLNTSGFSGVCEIANYNSPTQIVISGEPHAVQPVMLELKNAGAKMAIELSVGGAFHSALMNEAREKLKEALDSTTFNSPKFPIYSNVTGTSTKDPTEIKDRLYQQLTSPVLWMDTIQNMIKDGVDFFLEVGPGKVLQGLIKRTATDVKIQGVSNFEDLENFQWK